MRVEIDAELARDLLRASKVHGVARKPYMEHILRVAIAKTIVDLDQEIAARAAAFRAARRGPWYWHRQAG